MRSPGQQRSAIGLALLIALAGAAAFASPVAGSTTFVVNRIGDQADLNLANSRCDVSANTGNQCTLRAAIQEANDTPGADTINFNITSTSTTIAPASPLPPITELVVIDGYSQGGASANTRNVGSDAVLRIVLDGLNAGTDAVGLELRGSDSTVKGLVIQRFDGAGILLGDGGDHLVSGNFIGTNVTGTAARSNEHGVLVTSRGNLVGGTSPAARNVLSGNDLSGIRISGEDAIENRVEGNYIGTTRAGGARVPNGLSGVDVIDAPANAIGAAIAGARNVISGNGGTGVRLVRAPGSSVLGNHIGTNAAGTSGVGNVGSGITVSDIGDCIIGGSSAAARNVISGNGNDGIGILGLTGGITVLGNYIGLNAAGTAAIGNTADGVAMHVADQNVIGGTTAGSGNVISGNGGHGVAIDALSDNATIQGNRIGTRADGTADVGNALSGILMLGSNTLVGGPTSAAGNTIANSGGPGIESFFPDATDNTVQGNAIIANDAEGVSLATGPASVLGNLIAANGADGVLVRSAAGVRIQGNQIMANTGLGINLRGGNENGAGVTANDNDDPDTGANDRQNFPVLTQAVRTSQGLTTVNGTLNSNPSTEFRIELFIAAADGSGHGEGQIFVGSQVMTTNASGDGSFTFVSGALFAGQVLTTTATATNPGNTSEFSANRAVVAGP